jgi:hypothetical protein
MNRINFLVMLALPVFIAACQKNSTPAPAAKNLLVKQLSVNGCSPSSWAGQLKHGVYYPPQMRLDNQGNVYVATSSYQQLADSATANTTVSKFNPSGQLIWPYSRHCILNKFAVDGQQNVYLLAGLSGGYSGLQYVFKINAAGTDSWNKQVGGDGEAGQLDLSEMNVDNAGNVYFTGYTFYG